MDANKSHACLVNCVILDRSITCGFAWFRQFAGERVVLVDGDAEYAIAIPQNAQRAPTPTAMASNLDSLEFELCA